MSVTTPLGFRAAGVTAGLKASGKPDVALVVNDGPDQHAAAVFTTNRVEAAPVTWSRTVVSDGRADAVVLNSGGANACTGAPGFQDTHRTAEHVGEVLGVAAGDVVVCSTGLIGERLPMHLLLPGIDAAIEVLAVDGGPAAAQAIMTTDSVAKTAVAQREGWSVGGMAKGAGMLAPALATMLVVITTDAVIAGHDRSEVCALVIPRSGAQAPDLQQLLDTLAARSTGSSTRIARAVLLGGPLSIDAGEITDKGSINQRTVLECRADLVEMLYTEPCAPQVLRAKT